MNCLEFQRALRTDPGLRDAEAIAHRRECLSCAARFKRAQAFERALERAVQVVPPENLASRVMLAQCMSDARPEKAGRKRPRRRIWLALAASVAAVALVAGLAFEPLDRDNALADDVVHMVHTATYALMAEGPVQSPELVAALQTVGAELNGRFDEKVRFAGHCKVLGKLAGHLVLEGDRAPISLFVMPTQSIDRRSAIDSEHWGGAIVPVRGGSVAIVAAPGERIAELEARLQEILVFDTGVAKDTAA